MGLVSPTVYPITWTTESFYPFPVKIFQHLK